MPLCSIIMTQRKFDPQFYFGEQTLNIVSKRKMPFDLSLLPAIDWSVIPIPEEIEDLDVYLGEEKFPELDPALKKKYEPFLLDLLATITPTWTKDDLQKQSIILRRKYKMTPTQSHLLEVYRGLLMTNVIKVNYVFERVIRRKSGRSSSGVSVITTLLAPGEFSCPMDCDYCPNDPSIARSYLLDEPAVRRGFRHGWDAVRQFMASANRLEKNGHEVTKIEIIIEGGTFGGHPKPYTTEYFRDLYYAANILYGPSDRTPAELVTKLDSFPKGQLRPRLTLEEEIEINQTARCAIIGITIETRPDWINRVEIEYLRKLNVTRVQLGIQHIDEAILDGVNRECPNWKTIRGIRLLKENGFKVDGHFMPDLPGSNPEIDMGLFKFLFGSENKEFQCDQLKIYPTMALKKTKILEWVKNGSYVPYAGLDGGRHLTALMTWICMNIPPWIRINRMVRDMPMHYSGGGVQKPDLRDVIDRSLALQGLTSRDIRGREVGDREFDPSTARLWIDIYEASEGQEIFISYENDTRTILYGFVRLRLSHNDHERYFQCLKGSALIRELHVYGQIVRQDEANTGHQTQHLGIGTLLMKEAEKMAWEAGFRKCAIISGVGVRGFYRKLGYELAEHYMCKALTAPIAKSMKLTFMTQFTGVMILLILIAILIARL
jgi:elongator complex protein 3